MTTLSRQEIETQVSEFLARGGKIERLPPAPPPRATQVTLQELEQTAPRAPKKKPNKKYLPQHFGGKRPCPSTSR